MKRHPFVVACLVGGLAVAGLAAADPLSDGFADPPSSAHPRTWWHWMNGNVTKDGITKDLEWMKRVGLGGVQNFDANLATPQIVEKRLVYMTPEWKEAFKHAVELANSQGLEFTIAASPGWSETGGPWVKPEDAMKKLVWSETLIAGGKKFSGKLAAPPSTTGPFQSIRMFDPLAMFEGRAPTEPPIYYADVAVFAVPVAAADPGDLPQAVSAAGSKLDAAAIVDGSLDSVVNIERGAPPSVPGLTLSYAKPRTVRSATFFMPGAVPPFGDPEFIAVLQASVDGKIWQKVTELPLAGVPTTTSFAPVSARQFRLTLEANSAPKRIGLGQGAPGVAISFSFPPPAAQLQIAQVQLNGEAKVHRFEAKAGFAIADGYFAIDTPPESAGVAPDQVIDLTAKVSADGTLNWTPPKGRWRVVRLGYSLTGKTNHPATAEATGLEVDKYDGAAVRRYLESYLKLYTDAVGESLIGAHGIRAIVTDSIEVGPSNWTPALIERFTKLRGYDPRPWLPALTGTIIGSRAQSDSFLYDFRRTLADLLASEHYGTVATVAHERGLKVYGEALEDVRPVLGDDIAMRAHSDIPMAALWTWNREGGPRPTLLGDMKGASSVAHLYGQNITAAESMTAANSPWAFTPADLRPVIDLEFASGINRPVIHTSVHQPVDDKVPGLSLAIFGQYFNRHETWAEMARPWIDYIARNSYLLQQGRNVADVAYFHGEEQPLTALYAQAALADVPTQYAYDFVNAEALTQVLSVENGELVAKSGARYRVLYLGGDSERMTLATLRRIGALVEAGATVVGQAPKDSPSKNDDAAEFATLAQRLWAGKAVGKGRVIASRDVEAALASIGVVPDFADATAQSASKLLFVHRSLPDADIYFVTNRSGLAATVQARFRARGKRPEIWRADTGETEPVSYRVEGDSTFVPLEFGAEDSYFIVFRGAASATAEVAKPRYASIAAIDGPWDVTFQLERGAPPSARLDTLRSLSESQDPQIRNFSGTATYTKTFSLKKLPKAGSPLLLDLGQVGDLAEVRINGKAVGIAWKAPYRVDISSAVKKGDNAIEVRVANLWVNRLIGDAQPDAKKVTFTSLPTYRPDAPLRPSGLIGPVRILGVQEK